MIRDFFSLAIKNIIKRKMRSWLTMIGIFIGVAAVVALISLGQGLQTAVIGEFEKIGTDKIIIESGQGFLGGAPGSANSLTLKDVDFVKKINSVKIATGFVYKTGVKVEFNNKIDYDSVMGFPLGEEQRLVTDMQSVEIDQGRNLKTGDKYKTVVGWMLARDSFFGRNITVGDKILVEDQEFTVVGSFKRVGNEGDDSQIYIPMDTLRELFNEPDRVDMIFAQIDKGFEPADVAKKIEKELRKQRGQKEGEEDFSVQTFEQLLASFKTILNVVQIVLVGIAAISLLVGGVGIMNTMYTAVLERTREIGVMKAIGAKNSDILLLFLIESGMLGMAGGAIGIGIGVGLSKLVSAIATQALGTTYFQAYFPWYLIVGALAFSFIIGSLSGITPAIQASKKNPVEALRYE